jgi:hypothetical protein
MRSVRGTIETVELLAALQRSVPNQSYADIENCGMNIFCSLYTAVAGVSSTDRSRVSYPSGESDALGR